MVASTTPRRLYGGDIYLAHLHHGLEGAPGGLGVGIRDRLGEGQGGDLPGDAPLVLAPAALARLTTVIDDGVPIAIRLGLGLRCDLEREGPAVADPGAAIEPEAGDPHHPELDRQHIPSLAGGVVGRGAVHGVDGGVGEGACVKPCRLLGIPVIPEANPVLCGCHHLVAPAGCCHPMPLPFSCPSGCYLAPSVASRGVA